MNRTPDRRAWLAVGLLTLCSVFSLLDRLILTILVEPIKADLKLTDVQIGLLQGPAFAILYSVLGIPFGALVDTRDRRSLVGIAVACWSACTIAFGAAGSFARMFACRIGVGAGEAVLAPAGYAIISDLFPKTMLGRALAIFTTGSLVGSAASLFAGGLVFQALSEHGAMTLPLLGILRPWQLTFVVIGAPGLLIAALAWTMLPRRDPSVHRDHVSFAVCLRHMRAERRYYVPVLIAYAATGTAIYAFFSWTPSHLIRSFRLTPSEAGQLFGALMLATGVVAPVMIGAVVDRLFPRLGLSAPGYVMAGLLILLAAVIGPALGGGSLRSAIVGIGAVMFLLNGAIVLAPLAVQLATPAGMRGRVSAIALLCPNLIGFGIGPLGVAFTAERVFPEAPLGWAVTCVVIAASIVGLIACAAVRGSRTSVVEATGRTASA